MLGRRCFGFVALSLGLLSLESSTLAQSYPPEAFASYVNHARGRELERVPSSVFRSSSQISKSFPLRHPDTQVFAERMGDQVHGVVLITSQGRLIALGEVDRGMPVGTWTGFSDRGQEYLRLEFDQGRLVGLHPVSESGQAGGRSDLALAEPEMNRATDSSAVTNFPRLAVSHENLRREFLKHPAFTKEMVPPGRTGLGSALASKLGIASPDRPVRAARLSSGHVISSVARDLSPEGLASAIVYAQSHNLVGHVGNALEGSDLIAGVPYDVLIPGSSYDPNTLQVR